MLALGKVSLSQTAFVFYSELAQSKWKGTQAGAGFVAIALRPCASTTTTATASEKGTTINLHLNDMQTAAAPAVPTIHHVEQSLKVRC